MPFVTPEPTDYATAIHKADHVALEVAVGAATSNFVLITNTVLGAPAATITFSAIPQTYKHLRIVVSGRTDAAGTSDFVGIQFNGDTAGNYDYEILRGVGAAASATNAVANTWGFLPPLATSASDAGAAGGLTVDIPNYVGTTFRKAVHASGGFISGGTAVSFAVLTTTAWRNTAAITSIVLLPDSGGNFVTRTQATLYGIS